MTHTDDDDVRFKQWLTENGATWPKIDWPSTATNSGMRGAVATEDIGTDEFLLEIPVQLMMSPLAAYASEIGPYLRKNADIVKPHSDIFLTIFIMHERRKGTQSFYYPFLKILPEPGSIAHWSDEELQALQNDALLVRAKGRTMLVESTYRRTIVVLSSRHPEIFSLEDFSFENYKFCWYSIMARAFGKRLPWTSLVPFADCLNHSNVQTKYDYNVDDNGMFRLFPSGSNCYPKGSEVFNSYGRRPNDNLLLDYGFAMLDNEWDRVEIMLTIPETENLYEKKRRILYDVGKSYCLAVDLAVDGFPLTALEFLRIVVLKEAEIAFLLQKMGIPDDDADDGSSSSKGAKKEPSKDIFSRLRTNSSFRALRRSCFGRVISVSNEMAAIDMLVEMLQTLVVGRITTTAEDEILLATVASWTGPAGGLDDGQCGVDREARWRRTCAITYRLTRKRVVDATLRKLAILRTWLSHMTPSFSSSSSSSAPQSDAAVPSVVDDDDIDADVLKRASALARALLAGDVKGSHGKGSTDPADDVSAALAYLHMDNPAAAEDAVDPPTMTLELLLYTRALCKPTLPAVTITLPPP